MRRILGTLAWTTLAVAACANTADDGATGDGWAGSVDTLPTGRIVVRSADVPSWAPAEAPSFTQSFCLGGLDGDGPDVFGEVRDIEIGPAGNVFVLDGQAEEIREFDGQGEYVRTLGRKGEGPGELNRPAGMTLGPGGELWVQNWGNARYTAFDPATGELVEERRRLAGFTSFPWPGGFDRAGRLLDMGNGASGIGAVLLRLDTAFVPRDTLPMPTGDERSRVLFRRDGQLFMSMPVPFSPQPTWAPHPGAGIVVGEGAPFRLHRIDDRGDTTMTIELERAPARVSEAERDSALAAFREVARTAGEGLTADREPDVPDTKPAHGALFVDDRERIWARRDVPEGAAWDVFGSDGRYLGPVTIPVRPTYSTVSFRGGRLAVAVDRDGIPGFCVLESSGPIN